MFWRENVYHPIIPLLRKCRSRGRSIAIERCAVVDGGMMMGCHPFSCTSERIVLFTMNEWPCPENPVHPVWMTFPSPWTVMLLDDATCTKIRECPEDALARVLFANVYSAHTALLLTGPWESCRGVLMSARNCTYLTHTEERYIVGIDSVAPFARWTAGMWMHLCYLGDRNYVVLVCGRVLWCEP